MRNGALRCKKLPRRPHSSKRKERRPRKRLKSRQPQSVERKPRKKLKHGACKCSKSRSGGRKRQLRLLLRLQESRKRGRKQLPRLQESRKRRRKQLPRLQESKKRRRKLPLKPREWLKRRGWQMKKRQLSAKQSKSDFRQKPRRRLRRLRD